MKKCPPAAKTARLYEQLIYGAGRIGLVDDARLLYSTVSGTPAVPEIKLNGLGRKRYELTDWLGNVNAVITDRKMVSAGGSPSTYEAVVVQQTEYYPFGMAMPGRSTNTGDYRYAYNGMEQDQELKGTSNSYTTEFRQYDPRIGRWLSCDPKRHWFPSMSAYCYASNTPIVGKDDNGLYTIFVNGYIYGEPDTDNPDDWTATSDDLTPGKPYWSEKGDGFIKAAHSYFGDGIGKYVNGTGTNMLSTAWGRQWMGRRKGKEMADDIIKEIIELNNDDNPNNDVKEINFVTHSMGAAFAEGMIEEFMKHPQLAGLLKAGEIVHFSACDGDKIKISENSKELKRTQLNYTKDATLALADAGAKETGGYQIPDVTRFAVVQSDVKKMHPNYKGDDWDFHYDSKAMKETWSYLKAFDRKVKKDPKLLGKPVKIHYEDKSSPSDTVPGVTTKGKG